MRRNECREEDRDVPMASLCALATDGMRRWQLYRGDQGAVTFIMDGKRSALRGESRGGGGGQGPIPSVCSRKQTASG